MLISIKKGMGWMSFSDGRIAGGNIFICNASDTRGLDKIADSGLMMTRRDKKCSSVT
jgi:hypothetical protein